MDATVDVLVAVDAATMVASYPPGTPTAPTSIDKPLLFMIVRQANAVFGNAGKELKMTVAVGDTIRWRATSLSMNANEDVLLYKFFALRGETLLSPPQPLLATVSTPLPNPVDPLHPGSQSVKSYFWNTTVLQAGSVTYAFHLAVSDRHGAMLGYYYWDPFITITNE